MMEYQLSKQAAYDIEDIYLYGFLHFGEQQADCYAQEIEERFTILCSNPKLGRLDGRVNPAIRRIEFESHVIFYDDYDSHILIVRILHKSMDFLRNLS